MCYFDYCMLEFRGCSPSLPHEKSTLKIPQSAWLRYTIFPNNSWLELVNTSVYPHASNFLLRLLYCRPNPNVVHSSTHGLTQIRSLKSQNTPTTIRRYFFSRYTYICIYICIYVQKECLWEKKKFPRFSALVSNRRSVSADSLIKTEVNSAIHHNCSHLS